MGYRAIKVDPSVTGDQVIVLMENLHEEKLLHYLADSCKMILDNKSDLKSELLRPFIETETVVEVDKRIYVTGKYFMFMYDGFYEAIKYKAIIADLVKNDFVLSNKMEIGMTGILNNVKHLDNRKGFLPEDPAETNLEDKKEFVSEMLSARMAELSKAIKSKDTSQTLECIRTTSVAFNYVWTCTHLRSKPMLEYVRPMANHWVAIMEPVSVEVEARENYIR